MSWIIHDPDEWETVTDYHEYGRDPLGNVMASLQYYQRRRAPEDVARIKAEKRLAHENAILAEAEAIRLRRAASQ